MEEISSRESNLIRFLPVTGSSKVLIWGKVSSVISSAFHSLSEFVECFDDDCCKYTDKDGAGICRNDKQYDIIFIQDCNFLKASDSADHIAKLLELLSHEGKLYISADNPFSLHKLSGEAYDDGSFLKAFTLGGFEHMNGLGKAFLDKLAEDAIRISKHPYQIKFYYPYPDNRFPSSIYTDEYLPKTGECDENDYNFEHTRFQFFDEMQAVNEVIKSGAYQQFANGYLVEISKSCTEFIYSRYSAERRSGLRIRTDILKTETNDRRVIKTAYDTMSNTHIKNLKRWEDALGNQLNQVTYLGKEVCINKITKFGDEEGKAFAEFEFVNGESIENRLDNHLKMGGFQKCKEELLAFCDMIKSVKGQNKFEITEEFNSIFGNISITKNDAGEEMTSMSVTNIDMVCQNILIGDRNTLIDYEWTFDFPIPIDYIIYRVLFCYIEQKGRRTLKCFDNDFDFYLAVGINHMMKKQFEQMERSFQKYVQGDCKLLRDLYREKGKPSVSMKILEEHLKQSDGNKVDIKYTFDENKENDSAVIRTKTMSIQPKLLEDGTLTFVLDLPEEPVSSIEMHFAKPNSMVRIGLLQEGQDGSKEIIYETNATPLHPILYMYKEKPMLKITSVDPASYRLHVSLEVKELPKHFIDEAAESVRQKEEIIQNREQQIADYENSTSWKMTKPLREFSRKRQR